MKSLGALLIQSLQDAVAFEEGRLNARIQVRELTVHEAKSEETPEILQRKVHVYAENGAD